MICNLKSFATRCGTEKCGEGRCMRDWAHLGRQLCVHVCCIPCTVCCVSCPARRVLCAMCLVYLCCMCMRDVL